MATLLVTGATGTLGRALVQKLVPRHHVRVYTRQAHPAVPAGVDVYGGDIRQGSGLREATSGVDTIIHCVSVYEDGFVTDREGARQLIAAAKAAGSPHLVFISIVGIDHSSFPYFQAKLDVEHMVARSGLPYSTLRATQFHEYMLGVLTQWDDAATGTITIPAGSRFQPIDAREVADMLVALAQGNPARRVPDAGGPQVLTLEELAQTYCRVFGEQRTIRTHTMLGEYFDAFRDDAKLAPERAVGRITWEQFLQARAKAPAV